LQPGTANRFKKEQVPTWFLSVYPVVAIPIKTDQGRIVDVPIEEGEEKTGYKYNAKGQIIFEVDPNAKQVDFDSEEIRKEFKEVQKHISEIMENAKIDTSKLHIKFTI
jgi:YD repeat-containing protein